MADVSLERQWKYTIWNTTESWDCIYKSWTSQRI